MLNIKSGQIKINGHIVLDNVNLDISPSCLTIIMGPNGAGKTSLLNVLSGIRKLSGGNINNKFKKSILISQKTVYPEGITLFEYISSIFYKSGWKWYLSKDEETRVIQVLEKLNLLSKKDLLLNKLSAGELQLANIGLCLVSESDLLLLDEPSANLDLINQIRILSILKDLVKNGMTVVSVIHDLSIAAKYGDKFVLISQNGKLFCGDKEEVITSSNLSEAYNIDIELIEENEAIFVQPKI